MSKACRWTGARSATGSCWGLGFPSDPWIGRHAQKNGRPQTGRPRKADWGGSPDLVVVGFHPVGAILAGIADGVGAVVGRIGDRIGLVLQVGRRVGGGRLD